MAVVDFRLRRVRFGVHELEHAAALPTDAPDGGGEGNARDLALWMGDLLAPLSAPQMRAVAELHTGESHAVVAIAWRGADRTVFGRLVSGDETELREVEDAALPALLAAEVELVARPEPGTRDVLMASRAEVERAFHGRDGGPLGQIMGARRRSWRVSTVTAQGSESLGVVDSGAGGLWLSEVSEDGGVRLTPSSREEIAQRLAAMLAPAA